MQQESEQLSDIAQVIVEFINGKDDLLASRHLTAIKNFCDVASDVDARAIRQADVNLRRRVFGGRALKEIVMSDEDVVKAERMRNAEKQVQLGRPLVYTPNADPYGKGYIKDGGSLVGSIGSSLVGAVSSTSDSSDALEHLKEQYVKLLREAAERELCK